MRRTVAVALLVVASLALAAATPRGEVTVRGELLAADESPLAGTRIVARWPSGADTAAALGDGTFSLARDVPLGDSLQLTITDTASRADSGRFLPSLVRTVAGDTAPLRIVLVPARWTVAQGTFEGTVVPVSIASALAKASDGASFYRLARVEWGMPWHFVSWPESAFPLRVAFKHSDEFREVSTSDSAAFWVILRQLERDLGEHLFEPAAFAEDVAIQNQLVVGVRRSQRTAGLTWLTWSNLADISEGTLSVQRNSYLGDASIITHELMHALGFGHTSSWPSALSLPSADTPRATVNDAVYVQVLYRVRSMQRSRHAPFGLLEAAEAERAKLR